jgi:hypothetical protein
MAPFVKTYLVPGVMSRKMYGYANRERSGAPQEEAVDGDRDRFKVGKVLGRYKMGKHFEHKIEDGNLSWSLRAETIAQETKVDGIYVIRRDSFRVA